MAIGRKVYAVGGNETASRYSGIRVGFVKILVYTVSGSELQESPPYYPWAITAQVLPETVRGYELNVIAAAVVGGASLVGGKGTALGALLGAIILQMISNGLVILNIPQNYSQIVIGLVVIAAVLFDQFNAWMANQRLLAKTGSYFQGDAGLQRDSSCYNSPNKMIRKISLTITSLLGLAVARFSCR